MAVPTTSADISKQSHDAAASALEQAKKAYGVLDKTLNNIPLAVKFQEKTGVNKSYAALGVSFVTLVMIIFNIAGGLITNLVGFIYPAYASAIALESPSADDDKQWLTYWVVFGFFSIIEYFSDALLSWFPIYYMVKALCLVWLYLPATLGATTVYNNVFKKLIIGSGEGKAAKKVQ